MAGRTDADAALSAAVSVIGRIPAADPPCRGPARRIGHHRLRPRIQPHPPQHLITRLTTHVEHNDLVHIPSRRLRRRRLPAPHCSRRPQPKPQQRRPPPASFQRFAHHSSSSADRSLSQARTHRETDRFHPRPNRFSQRSGLKYLQSDRAPYRAWTTSWRASIGRPQTPEGTDVIVEIWRHAAPAIRVEAHPCLCR